MELTESQFQRIADCLPRQRGNVKTANLQLLNALLYVVVDGGANVVENRRFENSGGFNPPGKKKPTRFVGLGWLVGDQLWIWSFMRKLVPSRTTVSA
jgi:hypothetical protein